MSARLVHVGLVAVGFIACGASGDSDEAEEPSPVPAAVDLGITANNAFWYYADLEAATEFYTGTLGLHVAADYGFAKILHIAGSSYLTLVDEEMGMHSSEEPKTVALALVTDQLDAWWEYLSGTDVATRNEYTPRDGSAHDGFVILDPEGYFLEFERFNPHAENERFLPVLDRAETVLADGADSRVPAGLGFKASVLWLYYRDLGAMQRFWEERIGLEMIADQGWTKIYQTSPTGFVGLVDETRGMHSFTDDKAVTVSLWTDQLDDWFEHARDGAFELRSDTIETGNPRYRAFVGYDPEGYFVEFDTFLPHADNERLLEILAN
ncbi:MAG: VOC family protein [Gemmatimonadetes bacterium]|nr:VOC family protein [Gemmatimonadota bacterium]